MQNKEIMNKRTSILLLKGKPSRPSEGYIGPISVKSGKKRKDFSVYFVNTKLF